MSAATPTVTVAARFEQAPRAESRDFSAAARYLIRLVTFAALGLFGVLRWSTMLKPAPTASLLGLLALAVFVAAGVPLLRRVGWVAMAISAFSLCLVAFPIAGLRWHWFEHDRIAVTARFIGTGLNGLANAFVPYAGHSDSVRLVLVLGAAVLLLNAALVLAFAPQSLGDLRRAAAAIPLIALAVVPSTVVRPQLPYVQGLVLFVLLAAFLWGERIRRDVAGTAFAIAGLAGIGGALAAPRLDQHSPWVNYRAWAGAAAPAHVDTFAWNQTYGPLHWPRKGHVVMTVTARNPDYWKAEDLDVFNGVAWVAGSVGTEGVPLPSPDPSALARWSQVIKVDIEGMKTNDVIAAGFASQPSLVPGGTGPGQGGGTWAANRELGPGATYVVNTYSPQPSPTELGHAGNTYPRFVLDAFRSVVLPQSHLPAVDWPTIVFPAFHARAPVLSPSGGIGRGTPAGAVDGSQYGAVYALARSLAARAKTPYAFALSVERFLSHGYAYDETPPVSRYPLETFLLHSKVGYCQQFSGSMALLLRMGGVPARVATGFTTGARDAATNQWVVTDIDAHAWVEAWFPHYGWVRFDPTPLAAPARGGNQAIPFVKKLPGGGSGGISAGSHGLGQTSNGAGNANRRAGSGLSALLIVAVLAALVTLALLIRLFVRSLATAGDMLGELERALARTGRPLEPGVTLAVLERRFHDSPGAAAYVRALRMSRYGGDSTRPTRAQRRALREQLRHGLGLSGRIRALWALPPRTAYFGRRAQPSDG